MKVQLTIEQLQSLLHAQKRNALNHMWKEWKGSKLYEKVKEAGVNPDEFHEIRDSIFSAPFPDDFETLKKYLS